MQVVEDTIELDFPETNKLKDQLADNEVTVKIESERKLSFSSDDVKVIESKMNQRKDNYSYTLVIDNRNNIEKALVKFKAS